MARHNYVFLYAKVTKNPKIATNENGDYTKALAILTTVRGDRTSAADDNDYKSYRFDTPVIITKDPYLISQISEWRDNDIVIVKGMISSRDTEKKSICSVCGKMNSKPGTVMYITPIYTKKIKSYTSEEAALEDLKNNCEISNQCIVIGNLCENPKFYRDDNGSCVTQYNIAINRKFRVKTDPATLNTDYPHVKSYGDIAVADAMFLQTGASVLIDGYIQTRKFTKKCKCDSCGEEYETNDQAMEIVPYASEYLINCRDVEEIEEMKKKQNQSEFEDIFNVRPDENN